MEDKIDRFGLCPNCQISWDVGQIIDVINKMNCFNHLTQQERNKVAANYGYTEHNKIHFSKTISHELQDGRFLLECPNVTCKHVFDRHTGAEYRSMFDAIRNMPMFYSPDRLSSASIVEIDLSEKDKPGLQSKGLQVTHENYDIKETKLNPNDIVERFKEETKVNVLHVTPDNRQQVELEIHRRLQDKVQKEFPKMKPEDIDCPFDI